MTEFVNIPLMIPAARKLLHELEMVGLGKLKSLLNNILFDNHRGRYYNFDSRSSGPVHVRAITPAHARIVIINNDVTPR